MEKTITELKKEFADIDLSCVESIQKWFAKHPYLTRNDHSLISGRSLEWVIKLQKKAGFVTKSLNLPRHTPPKKVDTLQYSEDWDTSAWLQESLYKHSIREIARCVGVDKVTIQKRIKKYKLKYRSSKQVGESKNPLCTKAWCHHHYIEKRMTAKACSEIAGIDHKTFARWLNKFQIPVRSNRTNVKNKSPRKIWVDKLVYNLRNQEVVRSVKPRDDHIHVRFMNYFWESYYHMELQNRLFSYNITEQDSKLENIPPVLIEYENESLDEITYPAHITIPRRTFQKASIIEQRLAVHQMTWAIVRRGWIPMDYPSKILNLELEKLRTKTLKHAKKGVYYTIPSRSIGRRISEHFFPYDDLLKCLKSPRSVVKSLTKLSKSRKKINTHNLVWDLSNCTSAYKPYMLYVDPRFYQEIFENLKIRSLIDAKPRHGYRMMACALSGIKYIAPKTQRMQEAVEKGIVEFLGLDFEWFDGQNADLCILDGDLKQAPISEAQSFIGSANNLLYFVDGKNRKKCEKKYNPRSILKTKVYGRNTFDWFFLL